MLNFFFTNPLFFFGYIISLFIVITVHEFSHAFVAYQLGDPTAKLAGRLKLDPRVHLDPLGLFFLFFFGFGWGKPVPVDSFNLRNPRKDNALISLAGPGSNIIFAVVMSLLLRILTFFSESLIISLVVNIFLIPLIYLNILLAIFNLLPIHPLDGFKIVGGFLNEDQAREWEKLAQFGIIFLFMMIAPLGNQGSMISNIIQPVIKIVSQLLIPKEVIQIL